MPPFLVMMVLLFISRIRARCYEQAGLVQLGQLFSFPAYVRDATSFRARHSGALLFHFPHTCEMLLQQKQLAAKIRKFSFPAYVRDATARELQDRGYVLFSFPAYVRDATLDCYITVVTCDFHFPHTCEMLP